MKQNWFDTLSEALESESLLHTWDGSNMGPINYDQNYSYHIDDGTKYGRQVSIYRSATGRYERPIHYSCN